MIRFWVGGKEYEAPQDWILREMWKALHRGLTVKESAVYALRNWAEKEGTQ